MSKQFICSAVAVAFLAAVPAAGQSTITCGPLDNGRIADVFYKATAVFFDPIVRYEYEQAVLMVRAPCEHIVKTFQPTEGISFDLGEVKRVLDGQYEWELRLMPAVDPTVRKDLTASRGSGKEDDLWWSYWEKGAIPPGPSVDSAGFTVVKGAIVDPATTEDKSATLSSGSGGSGVASLAVGAAGFEAAECMTSGVSAASEGGGPVLTPKDTVLTNSDGTIRNSLCVGFDCLNDNTYSDTTILLTENNTRIKFDDTSTASSFPRRDWEIEANSNLNGGGNWLAINDCGEGTSGGGCAEDPVFLVEGNAPANSIRVDSSGRVGFGTSNPIVELHTASGDTPTLRLDQNTSSGFAAQVWDVGGNESNFFVRDATNGSTLPFRIRPGAPSNSLHVVASGSVGVGTSSPQAKLGVAGDFSGAGGSFGSQIYVQGATDSNFQLRIGYDTTADYGVIQAVKNGTGFRSLLLNPSGGNVGIGTASPAGELDVDGAIYQRGSVLHADYVFEPEYELETIEEHASFMWANKHLPAIAPRQVDESGQEIVEIGAQRRGLVEELEKAHIYIEQLNEQLKEKGDRVAILEERLARLEQLLPGTGGDDS